MFPKLAAIFICIGTVILLTGCQINAQTSAAHDVSILSAENAAVTGALKIQGEGATATIHFWNRTNDTISWTWHEAKPGNYRVELHYSLDKRLTGGKISLVASDQQIIAPAETTEKWADYRTFELGIIQVEKTGDVPVTLQAAQLPQMSTPAMPDVAWLSLTPTNAPATSKPLNQPGEFHGKAIFDGKTFAGWEGDLTHFRIEDGAIIGGSLDKSLGQNEFLCSSNEYGDFELRAKVKLVNGKGNGGIQFRSQRVANSREMSGYQADMADGCWGGLYDESRRRNFLGTRLNAAAMAAVLKRNDWNDYVIRCEGPRIRLWLNGVMTLDYTETNPDVPLTGRIGLQIHEGDPSEACYKDIELEELHPPHE